MAHIDVTRSHAFGLAAARLAAEEIVDELRAELPFHARWEDDTLVAHGAGFDARVEAEPDAVRVVVHLGLFLRPMRRKIRGEIEAALDRFVTA